MTTYVAHDCRNSRLDERSKNYCNNRWIDVDMTGATTLISTWKYCRGCCEKLGIDFEKQKPSDYRTEEENTKILNHSKKMIERRKQKSILRTCRPANFASLTPHPNQTT